MLRKCLLCTKYRTAEVAKRVGVPLQQCDFVLKSLLDGIDYTVSIML